MSPGLGMGTNCLGQSEPGFLLYCWTCRCLLVRRERPDLLREHVPTGGTALLDPQELPWGNAVFLAPWSEVPIGAIALTPPKLRPESRTCPRGRGLEPRENTSAPKTPRTSRWTVQGSSQALPHPQEGRSPGGTWPPGDIATHAGAHAGRLLTDCSGPGGNLAFLDSGLAGAFQTGVLPPMGASGRELPWCLCPGAPGCPASLPDLMSHLPQQKFEWLWAWSPGGPGYTPPPWCHACMGVGELSGQ